jgi:hypothetical protein
MSGSARTRRRGSCGFDAEVLPVSWMASSIADVGCRNRGQHPGRWGEAMRRFMTDLHAALSGADAKARRNLDLVSECFGKIK